MREIVFRGKSLDKWTKGTWLEGYFYIVNGRTLMMTNLDNPYGVHATEIDPNTVGQYIGIRDAEGEMLFEGDIVEYSDGIGVINFGEGCFCVRKIVDGALTAWNPAIDVITCTEDVLCVGNIYDNPELIGGNGATD